MNRSEKQMLLDMSLEELWKLFPIALEPFNPLWKSWYLEEAARIENILPRDAYRAVYHIGSTALEGIHAKPIIDILIEVCDPASLLLCAHRLERSGYLPMAKSEARISLNKGYTLSGLEKKAFHLHLRLPGDLAEVRFLESLKAHPQAAREYEALKLSLAGPFRFDRDGYTQGKTEFVLAHTPPAFSEK